jgi:hypothetical protein
MKIIITYEPRVHDPLDTNIIDVFDPDTYYYFRNVFVNSVTEYIKENYPRKFKKIEDHENDYAKWLATKKLIHKCYTKFKKKQQKYYIYKNFVYSYSYTGFWDPGEEIKLIRYDPEDLCEMLNSLTK